MTRFASRLVVSGLDKALPRQQGMCRVTLIVIARERSDRSNTCTAPAVCAGASVTSLIETEIASVAEFILSHVLSKSRRIIEGLLAVTPFASRLVVSGLDKALPRHFDNLTARATCVMIFIATR